MADDLAPVAVARPSSTGGSTARPIPSQPSLAQRPFADRADRGVEILSRWAGIFSFAAAVGAIGWLLIS
ncbi:hypothetical protein FIM10_04410 [Sphingomonadales bacterium 56]|uniref:Uncharacterized protein n=1 Tax=Sphingobium agri TaxID=2933566 RepID=A0ABT0DW37_9SPHN|nr:hypothetical protein [Sphingobium agri]MBY2927918.1 hypothetical protein [Sphingomonadales bacterium 56]MBY2958018.1 hypothetical protein [Sphingomonadales bacterium 58]MCK0531330.1 hypothetical protein [Sphingobium agri]